MQKNLSAVHSCCRHQGNPFHSLLINMIQNVYQELVKKTGKKTEEVVKEVRTSEKLFQPYTTFTHTLHRSHIHQWEICFCQLHEPSSLIYRRIKKNLSTWTPPIFFTSFFIFIRLVFFSLSIIDVVCPWNTVCEVGLQPGNAINPSHPDYSWWV